MLGLAALGGGTLWAMDLFWPFGPSYLRRPALAETPPLQPHARTSVVSVPVVIDLAAVRTTLDAAMPRKFSGTRDNPMSGPFGKSDIGWNIGRGTLGLTGRPEELRVSTSLSGTLRVLNRSDVRRGDAAAGVLNPDIESSRDGITGSFEEAGEIRGHATLISRPTLLPQWRLDPNLTGQVTIAEGGLSIGGINIDVSDDVKSAIDRAVRGELKEMEEKLQADPMIEQTARREWARLCRSISLASVAAGTPNLWLELKPIRAYASQPQFDANTIKVGVGIEAETRIVPMATNPNCPFPAQIEFVPATAQGRFDVSAPIEIPFAEIGRHLTRQLRGRTFPENADAAAQITVRRVRVFASGERLLISLQVQAHEQTTWFGFNARATVYITVRPELDLEQQVLHLRDMHLDVQSRAAFGLFGAAARAALPYFEEGVKESALIDLKPYVASAQRGIEAVIADFDKQDDGISTDAAVTALRLVGLEFDSKTMRVIAQVEGRAKIAVSKLPEQ